MNDQQLLQEYVANSSEEAFAALVHKYINLVYSSALRQVRDSLLAQDVAQAVFIILARKANRVAGRTVLAGWLLQATRYASLKALRTEQRRRQNEQKALDMNEALVESEANWQRIAPLLDQAMVKLNETDRNAVFLRFVEEKPFVEVAAALGMTEDAAKKRVTRALERLRVMLTSRGLPISAATLGTFLTAEAAQAAPPVVTASAVGAASAASAGPGWTLAVATLRAMFWTKLQFTASVATLAVLAGMAVWTAEELAFSTPKRALRHLAKAFSDGDGRKFVNGLYLTIDESPVDAARWSTTIEKLIAAQANLRRAATDQFGVNAVSNAMPIWHHLNGIVSMLTKSEERVKGRQASFPLTILGQTFPNVPLMLKTNYQWKLPVDLRVRGGRKIGGGQNNNFRMWFEGRGLHLSLETKAEFDADKAQKKLDDWANLLNQVAAEVRAGKIASADETWETSSKKWDELKD
jgi:RNA polymerase sigma factor (sigma-70 family)